MRRLLLFALLATMCVACNNELADEFPTGKVKSVHLIDEYILWDKINLTPYFDSERKIIKVYFEDEAPCNDIVSKEYAAVWNKSPKQSYIVSTEGFDELAEKHNDVGYDWEVLVVYDMDKETAWAIHCHTALERGLKKIEIVSDSDFDKEHPAGKSLNDVVKFYGYNYSQYLTSNVNKKNVDIENRNLGYFEKMCNELTESDLKILRNSVAVEFMKKPTLAKNQKLTITVTDIDGEVYSNTVEVKF